MICSTVVCLLVFLFYMRYRRLACITSWNLTCPHYFSVQMAEFLSCGLFIQAHTWLEIPPLSVLHRWGAVWLHHSEGSSVRGGDQGVFPTDCVCDGLRAQPGICTQRPETSKNNDEMCWQSKSWVCLWKRVQCNITFHTCRRTCWSMRSTTWS